MTVAELAPSLRNQIDARLDAIERVLLRAGVSYTERRNIVDEVASQAYELLDRRGTATNDNGPTQADVTAVLASLDPPESYTAGGFWRRRLIRSPPARAALTSRCWPWAVR